MPNAEVPASDRALVLLAAVAGMGAIVALPLSVSAPGAALLVFSVPLLLAVMGRLRAQPMLVAGAVVVMILVSSVVLLRIEALGLLAVIVLFAGPILAVILVGTLLRELDQVAAAAFLLGGTIAVVAGFTITGLDPRGATVVVLLVATVSLGITAARVTRALAPPAPKD